MRRSVSGNTAQTHTYTHTPWWSGSDQQRFGFVPPGLCSWTKLELFGFCASSHLSSRITLSGKQADSFSTDQAAVWYMRGKHTSNLYSNREAFIPLFWGLNTPNRLCLITLCSDTCISCELGGADNDVCVFIHSPYPGLRDENLSTNSHLGFLAAELKPVTVKITKTLLMWVNMSPHRQEALRKLAEFQNKKSEAATGRKAPAVMNSASGPDEESQPCLNWWYEQDQGNQMHFCFPSPLLLFCCRAFTRSPWLHEFPAKIISNATALTFLLSSFPSCPPPSVSLSSLSLTCVQPQAFSFPLKENPWFNK